MTSQRDRAADSGRLGPTWPRNRTLPRSCSWRLCARLCGRRESARTRRIVQRCLPVWNEHAMGPGVVAWRRKKGFPSKECVSARRADERGELAKIVSPAIASAPSHLLRSRQRWPLARRLR